VDEVSAARAAVNQLMRRESLVTSSRLRPTTGSTLTTIRRRGGSVPNWGWGTPRSRGLPGFLCVDAVGDPVEMVTMIDLAPTGVDRQVSMIFGYDNGAQAYLNTTSGAKTPTTATISGTKARIEIDGDFYAPSAFSLITRAGEARRFEFETQGRGLHLKPLKLLGVWDRDCSRAR